MANLGIWICHLLLKHVEGSGHAWSEMRSVGVAGSVGAVKGLLSCVGTGEGNCTGCRGEAFLCVG